MGRLTAERTVEEGHHRFAPQNRSKDATKPPLEGQDLRMRPNHAEHQSIFIGQRRKKSPSSVKSVVAASATRFFASIWLDFTDAKHEQLRIMQLPLTDFAHFG
jgi:hypothetical protein